MMTYLKVNDKVSNIERVVTQKAYDIINKNKRNPRYTFLAYTDKDGNPLEQQPEAPAVTVEKKTEPEKNAEPVADNPEGITVIRKKPGPKPKVKEDAQK